MIATIIFAVGRRGMGKSTPIGQIGETAMSLLGSLMIGQMLSAVMNREASANTPLFYLYADEFQRFATPAFATLIDETRKYRVSTTIAHQRLDQLDYSYRSAAMGSVNFALFQVTGDDAQELVTQFNIIAPDVEPDPNQWEQVKRGLHPNREIADLVAHLNRVLTMIRSTAEGLSGVRLPRVAARTGCFLGRHGEVDLKHNPHIASDEFKLLKFAQSRGLVVPKPHYLDESCELFPTPFLVIDYIEGDTEFTPSDLANYLLQMASQLAQIHSVDALLELSFLPRQGTGFGERPMPLDHSLDEGRIRDVLESSWLLAQMHEFVLLHGDYWPGNILWKDGELAAIIDWEDATIGDPLADLGNSRLEILWTLGIDAMHDFTDRYQSMTTIDFTNLPYWDLCATLRPCSKISNWGLDGTTERRMRERHKLFITQAIEGLTV